MAKAIEKETAKRPAFSGELIRLYEKGENNPGEDARAALAKVFGKTEAYIMYGVEAGVQRQESELTADERALIARYRQADPRWQLSLRLLAALATEDQIEAATDVNVVIARIMGKKPAEVRYASNEAVAEAFGKAPHVVAAPHQPMSEGARGRKTKKKLQRERRPIP